MLSISESLKSCHICESKTSQSEFFSCTNSPHCKKHYCIQCIRNLFSPQFSTDEIKISTWVCFSCQDNCRCTKCIKKPGNEKIINVKKTLQFSIPKESKKDQILQILDIDEESEEYVTPSFLKAMQKPYFNQQSSRTIQNSHNQPNPLFETFRQESMTPFEYSSEINIGNERKSKAIIKCKKERNFVGLKTEKLPPYLDSIMKRKETFRNFMIKHSKKTYEELVREQMERVQNEKRLIKSVSTQKENMPSPVMKISPVSSSSIIENLVSPVRVPQTPSFVPIPDPLPTVSTEFKITDLLNEQLKEYEMEEDDLSIELI